MEVQIFGLKSSSATRAAERFFKERCIKIHHVDLAQKPMSPGEIGKFVQRFGLNAILDVEGKAYKDAGLEYLRVSDEGMMQRVADDPKLLKLPLVRAGKHFSVGLAEADWKRWVLEAQEAEKAKR